MALGFPCVKYLVKGIKPCQRKWKQLNKKYFLAWTLLLDQDFFLMVELLQEEGAGTALIQHPLNSQSFLV